jgi:hypothetical protein
MAKFTLLMLCMSPVIVVGMMSEVERELLGLRENGQSFAAVTAHGTISWKLG